MADNEKGDTETEENPNIDSSLDKDKLIEKLELVAAETEKIKSSQKRKFDEIAERLQSIEGSISKIPKFEDNEKKLKTGKTFVLKHVFENVANLNEGVRVTSKKEEHYNVNWFIDIERNGVSDSHLRFYVICYPITPVEGEWSIETKTDFKMMNNDYETVTKTTKTCFKSGFDNFLKWDDINDYLVDNKLTVQVEVEILKMTGFGEERLRKFDESQKEDSDVVLVVGDNKFYVLKKYLALQSSYFKSLFFGKFGECQKNEVELKDINPDDFQKFLELIHGESPLNDNTVAGILLLADMYDTPTAMRRCEEFLLKDSQKSMLQKLQLSLRCNLENLKCKCLSEVNTFSDVESITTANLHQLNLSTSNALLQKCIDFSKK
ncbi:hypothetical protein B9Z55_009185 [Caenorhabditis nigoni]|uniref:BTB domain-containing protein n=1 Tax=Caenorhabditis nigoni TaxID=1611254 RepID=A0A2G5UR01_9PELO|nr:hypothetical protein B9Z55_009185 [Caenorhabditis nigoni]